MDGHAVRYAGSYIPWGAPWWRFKWLIWDPPWDPPWVRYLMVYPVVPHVVCEGAFTPLGLPQFFRMRFHGEIHVTPKVLYVDYP